MLIIISVIIIALVSAGYYYFIYAPSPKEPLLSAKILSTDIGVN